MPIEPPEIPPATPGQPTEPPREEPPGSPRPEVPPPVREPGQPPQPQELPGKTPDELPVLDPMVRARRIPLPMWRPDETVVRPRSEHAMNNGGCNPL